MTPQYFAYLFSLNTYLNYFQCGNNVIHLENYVTRSL